ncbi:hypothetical protein LQG66_03885 [Bradyrhizobium ontarionense]|uniref:Uncharacterized protein n=1 Tax=Bradyrhizobium ontarionense TaxID=2898149 RepID=A0ABY3RFA5_9BRAD|nr:hypothetical protein [Bradyrhizobium sp. A19]UFZ05467.1 hypothetical protein LQG66_03885 [Bradyrhizobium sp. A19]
MVDRFRMTDRATVNTSLDTLFIDDFGGSAINPLNWDVIDGGLPAIVANTKVAALADLPAAKVSQAKIGSGITGITDAVASSALTVNMGTIVGAERWYLSRDTFLGKEDILVVLSKSQALAANSIFVGLIEVDAATGIPLLNPNFAADGNGSMEFTNRGGVEFGLTATNTAFQAEAIGDGSPNKAAGGIGNAAVAWTTAQECLIEIDSRDITTQTSAVDTVSAKGSQGSRVSTQCPNDKKLYKLVMRFRNVTAPGSATTVTVQRALVVNNFEQRVQISTGEGDQLASKGIPVILVGANGSGSVLGTIYTLWGTAYGSGVTNYHKAIAAATTNPTSVRNAAAVVTGGQIFNASASVKYFKLYNKASAPTVGTDVPIETWGIPAGGFLPVAELIGTAGLRLTTGLAYAITGAAADSDTTALAAGDVIVNLHYNT